MNKLITLLSTLVCFFVVLNTAKAETINWSYPFLVHNDIIYEVDLSKEVNLEMIESEIGFISKELNHEEKTFKNETSNIFPKGTSFYKIEDISENLAIAVYYEEKYLYAGYKESLTEDIPFLESKLGFWFGIFCIFIGFLIFFYAFYQKNRKKG